MIKWTGTAPSNQFFIIWIDIVTMIYYWIGLLLKSIIKQSSNITEWVELKKMSWNKIILFKNITTLIYYVKSKKSDSIGIKMVK